MLANVLTCIQHEHEERSALASPFALRARSGGRNDAQLPPLSMFEG